MTFELVCKECESQILLINDDELRVEPTNFLCPNCASTKVTVVNFYKDSATMLAALMSEMQNLEDRLTVLEGENLELDS